MRRRKERSGNERRGDPGPKPHLTGNKVDARKGRMQLFAYNKMNPSTYCSFSPALVFARLTYDACRWSGDQYCPLEWEWWLGILAPESGQCIIISHTPRVQSPRRILRAEPLSEQGPHSLISTQGKQHRFPSLGFRSLEVKELHGNIPLSTFVSAYRCSTLHPLARGYPGLGRNQQGCSSGPSFHREVIGYSPGSGILESSPFDSSSHET